MPVIGERSWVLGILMVLGCGGSGQSATSDGAPGLGDATPPADADLITCAGQGPQVCSPMPCPAAGTGNVRVCGRLVDLETSQPIAVADPSGGCCDPTAPTIDGPCGVTIRLAGVQPSPPQDVRINDCGYYMVLAPAPPTGYLSLVVDDVGPSDDYAPAAVSIPSSSGLIRSDLSLYALRRSTDEKWTQTAGDPFGGQTFSEFGVFVQIFLHDNGQPGAGVTSTANGSPLSSDVYYFSDTDPALRTTVATGQSATGANGTALLVNAPLVNRSGTGGNLMAGCEWSTGISTSMAGYAMVGETGVVCP